MKKFLFTLFTMVIFFGCFADACFAKITELYFEPKNAYIEVGQEVQFKVAYETDSDSEYEVTFYHGDLYGKPETPEEKERYSLTEDGLVTGLVPGDAQISVKLENEEQIYVSSTYIHVITPIESINTDKEEYTKYLYSWDLGGDVPIKIATEIQPNTNTNLEPSYSIADETVLEQGEKASEFIPKNFGSTEVTITAGRKSKTVKVNIIDKDKEGYSTFDDGPSQTIIAPTESSDFIPDQCDTGSNDYDGFWFKPVKSYLESTNNGFMKVCGRDHSGNKVIVDYYDENFKPIAQKSIDFELPLFGGFYNGKNNFYVVFGQRNVNEDDNQEVLRIVKYDKNWNRVGAASVKGGNTITPFSSGTLRMVEYKDKLHIKTSHSMYASKDGLSHQSNMTIEVDIPTMIAEVETDGYVSHSFNQFIITDKNDLISLDQGDAYPRAAQLYIHNHSADGLETLTPVRKQILKYFGNDVNNTNATIGGLEASDNYYLTVGCSTPQTSFDSNGRNIYVTATPKSEFKSTEDHNLRWLTQGEFKGANPHLVKFDNNNFLVIWNKPEDGNNYQGYYVFVDGSGNPKGQTKTFDGQISDCKPVVKNNKAYWTVVNGTGSTLYSMDTSGNVNKSTINVSTTPIYRLYNNESGEHLYTSDQNEYNVLPSVGWTQEGIGWNAPSNGTPVFRLYNPALADHLYTTDNNEVNVLTSQAGWQADNNGQPLFYSGGSVSVFRLYNAGNLRHLLTKDENEYNVLGGLGWSQEGVGLNALS